MKNILIILLFILSTSCVKVNKPYTYKIMYLESDTIAYTNKLAKFDEFPEDAIVYQLVKGKYIKIIQIYE